MFNSAGGKKKQGEKYRDKICLHLWGYSIIKVTLNQFYWRFIHPQSMGTL